MHPRFGRRDPYDDLRRQGMRRHGYRGGTIAALGAIVLLALWAGATTLYLLFRDDALRMLAQRQVAIVRAHDARTVQLEGEIERLRSIKLVEQERVERALSELARRQSLLETRQAALAGLAAPAANDPTGGRAPETTGSLPPRLPSPPAARSTPKPAPISDTILFAPPPERRARLESRPFAPLTFRLAAGNTGTPLDHRILDLARGLEQLESVQSHTLNSVEESFDGAEGRMRSVFSDLGIKPPKHAPAPMAAIGGPLLSFLRAQEDPFQRQLDRIRAADMAVATLRTGLEAVPLRRPLPAANEVTSGFGMRIDPFVRQLAMHAGVDFRGDPGDPVRAAAAGKVVQAEKNAAYGLMVEIDHGNGIVTRYAHLSAVDVANGAHVKAGAVIGRVGSSGRSTGPHLHYEVRVGGATVDPQKYLRAGIRLGEQRAAD